MCVISSYRNCNFSIAFPLRDNGPTSEPHFTWHHFTLSLFFPPFFLAYQFSKRSTQIFHCFPIFSIVLYHSLSFSMFFSSFSPPFPFFSHCFMSYSLIFHCFSHHFPSFSPPFPFFPIVLYHIPSFFPLFFSSFSPPLQSPLVLRHIPSFVHCLFHNPYSCTA